MTLSSDGSEALRDLRRNVEVADDQIDQIRKRVEVEKATSALLDHLEDAVNALAFSVGDAGLEIGQDVFLMLTQCRDEFAHRLQAAQQRPSRPVLQKLLRRPDVLISPEVLKFILEEPRAVDPVVAALQFVDGARLPLVAGR